MSDVPPCQARRRKRGSPICGDDSDTIRKIQAAPGLWIHVPLCHAHQHVWDEALDWGGPEFDREPVCDQEHGP